MQCMPGLGDPALAARLTVGAYALTVLACGLNARRADGHARVLWAALALALVPFAIVEHFDLHMALLEDARGVAGALQWRLGRTGARVGLGLGLLAAAGAAAVLLVLGRRGLDAGAAVALAGAASLAGLVAARAAYFDRLDAWAGLGFATPCSYRSGELVALALVAVGARISARRSRRGAGGSVIAAPARRSRDS